MLTADDLRSTTWLRLAEHLRQRRAELLGQLEKDSSPEVSAKLRGRLAQIKELLALQAPALAHDPALAALGIAAPEPQSPEHTSDGA